MSGLMSKLFSRVSAAPTNPRPKVAQKAFDVADPYRGPADPQAVEGSERQPLDERLRQAYY